MQSPVKELGSSLRLLFTRRFGTFWFATLLSNIGTWAQQVAEPWLMVSIGASSFLIGLDSFASNAPVWALTLFGGMLADRADRRKVIALFQSIQMLCPLLLVFLLWKSTVGAVLIIILSFIVGITDALSMPSFQSIIPSLVERDQIGRGLALNSAQFNLSRILGPAIAGVLMVGVGAVACFAVSAASYIPFIGVALWIIPKRAPRPPGDGPSFDLRHPFSGLGEILRQRHLRGALLTVLVTGVFCGPLVTFVPVLVKSGFGSDASHFSYAISGFGVGGLIGALVLLSIPQRQDRRRWSSYTAVSYGGVIVGISFLPWFWGLPAAMVLAGASMTISNTSANSMLQATVDSRVLGQTASLYMLALRGGLSVGSLITGASIDLFGVRRALLINGAIAVILNVVIGQLWIRRPLPPAAEKAIGAT